MNIYREIFQQLNENKIKYLVVGGVAVNLHGYMRMTGDIDILLALDQENILRMDKLMKKMGYCPRIPVELQELSKEKQVRDWIKNKNMQAYTLNPEKNSVLQIDIIIEESLNFKNIYPNKIIKKMDDLSIPVIGINDLIKMKKKANRKQDLEDLEALFEIKGL